MRNSSPSNFTTYSLVLFLSVKKYIIGETMKDESQTLYGDILIEFLNA